jgi:hypothetical protein
LERAIGENRRARLALQAIRREDREDHG